MANALSNIARFHWRVWGAVAFGIVSGLVLARFGLKFGESLLIAWALGAAAFLIPTGRMLLYDDEATARRRACRDDEGVVMIMAIVLLAVAMGFAAVFVALREGAQGSHKAAAPWLVVLALFAIIESWLVVQSIFALHYAHRYFGDPDEDGERDQGFQFTGDAPSSYRDFVYIAVCMGATFQVSDFSVTKTTFRNLVTAHALLAFFFNTLVLALGINIVSSLLGGGGQ